MVVSTGIVKPDHTELFMIFTAGFDDVSVMHSPNSQILDCL